MTFNIKDYPTSAVPPQDLWAPQNTQRRHPFRPTVSSRGAVTYGVTRELANII